MQTQHLERPEGMLAYSDYGGSGQPVIMLPGMGTLRSEYRFLAQALSQAGYRAVTVDLRGHGDSSVPWKTYDVSSMGNDITALIEHLAAGPAHLVGNSFGAAPVVWVAAERPESTRAIVLINPFVRNAKINPVMGALFWLMLNNPWRVRTWTKYYSTLYLTQKPTDFQEYLAQLRQNLAQPGRFDAVAALGSSSRQPSDERLEHVKAPTLVIMGSKDPDFPDPAAEGRIVADRTGGTMKLVEGAGHYPQTEMPDETASIVLGFIK